MYSARICVRMMLAVLETITVALSRDISTNNYDKPSCDAVLGFVGKERDSANHQLGGTVGQHHKHDQQRGAGQVQASIGVPSLASKHCHHEK